MRLVSSIILVLALAGCAAAREPVTVAPAPPALIAAPNILHLLPPAPTAGSKADKDDVAAMLSAQARRTQAQCDFAQADVDVSLRRFLAPLGMTLNGDTVESDALLALIMPMLRTASARAKNLYKRPRPYNYDNRLIPCIAKVPADSFSYPSGHSAAGYMVAALLSEIIPEQQGKWYGRAAEFAQSRTIGGVHYPSDVEAGKIIGLILIERALRDPAMHAQLQRARPELRRALGY